MKSTLVVFLLLILSRLGMCDSLSINLDGKKALRFAQIEHEGANNLDSERTGFTVKTDGGTEGRASLVRAKPALDSLKPDGADDIAGNTSSEYQASPIQTPSIVEAFYSRNQRLIQDWKVGYDNSLFVRLDQPGFISPYFYLLRARNLIVP